MCALAVRAFEIGTDGAMQNWQRVVDVIATIGYTARGVVYSTVGGIAIWAAVTGFEPEGVEGAHDQAVAVEVERGAEATGEQPLDFYRSKDAPVALLEKH